MMTRSGSVQSVSTAGISEMTSASGQSGASNAGGDDNDNDDVNDYDNDQVTGPLNVGGQSM